MHVTSEPSPRGPIPTLRKGGGQPWAWATREDETILTEDGYELTTSWFHPDDAVRGAVLIAPAMAVPQSHYDPFARWLASRGFLAVTFDYRGSGASLRGSLRDLDADVFTWARDAGAVLSALRARVGGLPITWIGHSLGGQIVPFVPGHQHLRRVVTVAVGTGYWRDNAAATRWRAAFLWHVMVPPLLSAFGYFPGKPLRMVGNLPFGVMEQWRRWCMHPEYVVGVEGPAARQRFEDVTVPITSISFTDDEMMSARNTEIMHSFFTSAPRQMVRVSPDEMGLQRIGHFGFFRRGMDRTLWERLMAPQLR